MSQPQATLLTPRVLIPFIIITLIWGSTWIVIKDQLGNVPPSWSVAYRFAAASAAMFLYAAIRKETLFPGWKAVGFAGLLGLAQFVLNFNFVYRSEAYITSGLVAVLFALLIVPNSLMGRLFLGTKLEKRFLVGAGVAIVGVALMLVQEVRAAALGPTAALTGTALALAGMLSASTANVMQGTKIARAQSMVVMIAWATGLGTLMNAAFALATVGAPVIETDWRYIGGVLYLGVIGSAIAFPMYFNIIRAVGPSQAAWSSVLIPIIAMGISTVVEGYHWASLSIIGGLLALVGLVIAVIKRPAKPSLNGNMVSVPVDPES
jgi:drug/metabolite transporter (DMT)-like permease